ncbi:hypothetical protein ONE63_002044 [Megalurothrips usitatus]|uniref:Uncharacterized protein n=1 Tax=Megalurothrips usitatus TaxID=439358 RepID=A0AAV7XB98_9NEOP|nr:hypothetical protein ONE63_002044 [Megalurothrips usitatus]
MATKKGGAVALQQDVTTDEEWDGLMRRQGLLLIDVYSEWCGPCVGMLANLKKIKVELGGDLLVLATAKSDTIEALTRHRNHSEPVWMLVSGGRLIELIFGADAPRIARLIATELDNEVKLQRGEECPRTYMSWDELTPEEEARLKRAEEKRLRAQEEEAERRARALRKQKLDNYAKLAAKLNRYTLVLLLPHAVPDPAAADAEGGVLGALHEAWGSLGLEERHRSAVQVTADMANEIFLERKLPQHDELTKALAAGPCLAFLLHKPPAEVEVFPEPEDVAAESAEPAEAAVAAGEAAAESEEAGAGDEAAPPPADTAPLAAPQPPPQPQIVLVEPEMGEVEALAAQSLYGFYPAEDGANGQPPQQPQPPQQQEEDAGDAMQQSSQWSRFQPAADSPAAACVRSGEGSGPALPGLWTPLTPTTKAAAMQTLFPEDTLQLTKPPPPPSVLPPSLVFVFGAGRCKDVLAALATFDGVVTGSGLYSEKRELLAADEAEYEALKREKKDSDAFVVAVAAEAAAEAVAALQALQPLSASANAEEGAADCDAYFPGPVQDAEAVEEDGSANGLA